jgi:ABC-type sugar transport system substrate-binding protein
MDQEPRRAEVKKLWMVVLVLAVAASLLLAACGGTEEETTTASEGPTTTLGPIAEGSIIGVCLPALDNPLMIALKDMFVNNFGATYDVQASSAEGNPSTQATQVENYTAAGAKFVFVMAVEPTSLLPKLEAAREAGVFVMTVGAEPGESGRDVIMKMDQFLAGAYCALMAKNWVEATYPGAAEASIETAVLVDSTNTEAVQRSNGLLMISEPFLKDWEGAYLDAGGNPISDKDGKYLDGKTEADRVDNPVYCAAVKIVQTPTAQMSQAGQAAMENILTTNPDVKLVLAYSSDGGAGASQAILDEVAKGGGSVIADLSKVAVFGVGMFGPEGDLVKAASRGEGALRGVIAFGGPDLVGKTAGIVAKILKGEAVGVGGVIWDELALAVGVDGELGMTPMQASGMLSATPATP